MENFSNTDNILTSFIGTLLALLSAGLIWSLKSAYEKHRNEKLALAKFERIFANNLTILRDNFEFVDNWISALESDRPYSFHLEKYLLDQDSTFKLSNLELINNIISINYKLRRTSADLENIYKNYWKIVFKIDSIPDPSLREANLKRYHSTVIDALRKIKGNYDLLNREMIEVVALIRVADKVRFHSLFGYFSFLFIDVFPRVTDRSKAKEVKKLEKNIKDKTKSSHLENKS